MKRIFQVRVDLPTKLSLVQKRPTKRAVDGGDSAAFSGFFYTRTESWSWSFIYARPTATNANRWAVGHVNQ